MSLTIDKLIEEISYLKNKAALLDEILRFYDRESITFIIPEKWDGLHNFSTDKLRQLSKSPRHHINKKISETLNFSECERYVNWEKIDETAAD